MECSEDSHASYCRSMASLSSPLIIEFCYYSCSSDQIGIDLTSIGLPFDANADPNTGPEKDITLWISVTDLLNGAFFLIIVLHP